MYTHNIACLDSWPVVHEAVLVETLDKHLADDFDAGVKSARLDVREDGRPFVAGLHGRSGTPWAGGDGNLRAERNLVATKRVERLLCVDDEDAVVYVHTEQELGNVSLRSEPSVR